MVLILNSASDSDKSSNTNLGSVSKSVEKNNHIIRFCRYYCVNITGVNTEYNESNDRTVNFSYKTSGKHSLQIALFPGFFYTLFVSLIRSSVINNHC